MAKKPPPRHAAPTRRRRVVARDTGNTTTSRRAPELATAPTKAVQAAPLARSYARTNVRRTPGADNVRLGSFASIAVTVAGATVMAGGAHGYGDVVTIPPTAPAEVAGTQQTQADGRLGRAEVEGVIPNPLPAPPIGPASSLQEERDGRPASIWINSISTGSELIDLGLNQDGALEVPTDFGIAGWWKGGPRPGDPGPAVITGHLDSTKGPGVFAKLGRVKPGDEVTVRRNDGAKLIFVVTRIDRYPKRAFPTRTVYGPTDGAELRVITCGGGFDRSAASYTSNIVVFAKLIGPVQGYTSSAPGSARA